MRREIKYVNARQIVALASTHLILRTAGTRALIYGLLCRNATDGAAREEPSLACALPSRDRGRAKLKGRPAEITPLKAAVTKEDADYEQSRKADQTALIQQADDERDALLNQALTLIDAMAKVSAIPTSQQSALRLKTQVDIYKSSAKLALRRKTTSFFLKYSRSICIYSRFMKNVLRTINLVALF